MGKVEIQARNTIDLQNIFDEYISEKASLNISPSTVTTYKDTFKDYYKNLQDSLTTKDIYTFINILRERGNKTASINHNLRHLRAFANWAAKNEYIESVKIKLLKEEETIKATFNERELRKLLQRPKKNDAFVVWRTWAAINWLIATGNRFGTMQGIRVQDVNLSDEEVYIHNTKNKKIQILPISKSLGNSVRIYLRMWRSEAEPTDPLFCDVYGDSITRNALFRSIKKYCLNRDIEKYGIHIFRHTFAKQFILNGGGVFQLQKILGHSTLDMTRKYVNLYSDDLKSDMQNCNPLDCLNRRHQVKRKP